MKKVNSPLNPGNSPATHCLCFKSQIANPSSCNPFVLFTLNSPPTNTRSPTTAKARTTPSTTPPSRARTVLVEGS